MATELKPLLKLDSLIWGPKVPRKGGISNLNATKVLNRVLANQTKIEKQLAKFKEAVAKKGQVRGASKVVSSTERMLGYAKPGHDAVIKEPAREVSSAVGSVISHYMKGATKPAADNLYDVWASGAEREKVLKAATRVAAAASGGSRHKTRRARTGTKKTRRV